MSIFVMRERVLVGSIWQALLHVMATDKISDLEEPVTLMFYPNRLIHST